MSNNRIILFSFLAFLSFSSSLFAQDPELGTEVVNIVKPYSPTISDAFKIKETPDLNDSIATTKKDVKYSIFSVPVASTFTPAKGKATTVEKTKAIKSYQNYATLGFGNYTTILGELYSNFEISRTDNVGLFFRHNSSQGSIKDVRLDNKFYDTNLDLSYTSRQSNATYRLDAGAEHQIYNWYGLPKEYASRTDEFIDGIDPQQTYFSGYLGGKIDVKNSFFERAALHVRYLGDAFSSSEIHATLRPEFSFPLEGVNIKIDADLDYLGGSFSRNYTNTGSLDYSIFNAGLIPSMSFETADLTLSIGVAGYLSLDSENSETNFFMYPKINASYRLIDELLTIYAGVDGGLEQNSFYNLKEQNPFISPTLALSPTSHLYDGFAGIKGKITNSVGYNLKASYGKDENRALFQVNPSRGFLTDYKGYEHGNSFNVVYDDINILGIFGELQVEVSDMVSIGLNANYNNYATDKENQAWNLPNIKASLFSNFNITKELYGGVSVFYVGERKDLEHSFFTSKEVTLDAYVDANIHFGYRFTERLSVFVKGSNLFSDNYEKWTNYPVQGIQGLVGATYKFDW